VGHVYIFIQEYLVGIVCNVVTKTDALTHKEVRLWNFWVNFTPQNASLANMRDL